MGAPAAIRVGGERQSALEPFRIFGTGGFRTAVIDDPDAALSGTSEWHSPSCREPL